MDMNVVRNNIRKVMSQSSHKETYDENAQNTVKTWPFFGRIHFVNDHNGMMQLGGIFLYWLYGTFSVLFIMLLPHYEDGRIPLYIILAFLWVSAMCLVSLVQASTTNPGRIPRLESTPHLDNSELTYCMTCQRKRPKRAHHCRRCGQCVMRMDHHCPWINNCVGEANHCFFMRLLFYAMLLSAFAFVLLMFHFWAFPRCSLCNKEAFHIKHSIWFLYVTVVLSAGMANMMFVMFMHQHFNIIADVTSLEKLQCCEMPESSTTRSCREAYGELFGTEWIICWCLPFRRRRRPVLVNSHMV